MAILVEHQLELIGFDEAKRLIATSPTSEAVKTRLLRRVDKAFDLKTALPTPENLTFNHSGLCQTFLPHSRLPSNATVWKRKSGRFTLMVTPGVYDGPKQIGRDDPEDTDYVGVPYGARSRLILFHLQTEGLKSRTVPLGKNLSAFLRSLDLPRTGGASGTIAAVREQCMRIARCNFTMQWTDTESERMVVSDQRIVDDLELWNATSDDWSATIQLSEKFHTHLREHAVPLDKRSIALLSGNSLALDLYALFAHRLPKLTSPLHVSWLGLQAQIGSEYRETKQIARKIRETMREVLRAYPEAKVGLTRNGLMMYPSPPSVPRAMVVNGFRMVQNTP